MADEAIKNGSISTENTVTGSLSYYIQKEYPELEKLEVEPSLEEQNFKSEKYGYETVKVNAIKTDNLVIEPKEVPQEFDGMYKNIKIEAMPTEGLVIAPKKEEQKFEGLFNEVVAKPIETQKLTVTPSKQEQSFSGLYDTIMVKKMETERLETNSSEVEQNFNGLYDSVTIKPYKTTDLMVTPTDDIQEFEGLYKNVSVNGVISENLNAEDLDFSNKEEITMGPQREGEYIKTLSISKPDTLTPENIKAGKTIMGVTGTAVDTKDGTVTENDIPYGKVAYAKNKKNSWKCDCDRK